MSTAAQLTAAPVGVVKEKERVQELLIGAPLNLGNGSIIVRYGGIVSRTEQPHKPSGGYLFVIALNVQRCESVAQEYHTVWAEAMNADGDPVGRVDLSVTVVATNGDCEEFGIVDVSGDRMRVVVDD